MVVRSCVYLRVNLFLYIYATKKDNIHFLIDILCNTCDFIVELDLMGRALSPRPAAAGFPTHLKQMTTRRRNFCRYCPTDTKTNG